MSTTAPISAPALPVLCPSWRRSQHEQALEEGCTFDEAAQHMGADLFARVYEISNAASGHVIRPDEGSWTVVLKQEASDPRQCGMLPLIWLEVRKRSEQTSAALRLTTAEARQLAAQLTHLADCEDFAVHEHRTT